MATELMSIFSPSQGENIAMHHRITAVYTCGIPQGIAPDAPDANESQKSTTCDGGIPSGLTPNAPEIAADTQVVTQAEAANLDTAQGSQAESRSDGKIPSETELAQGFSGETAPEESRKPIATGNETAIRFYRKKAVVVQALQLSLDSFDEMLAFVGDAFFEAGGGVGRRTRDGRLEKLYVGIPWACSPRHYQLRLTAAKGDWVLRDKAGRLWACEPDEFAEAFEPVPAPLFTSADVCFLRYLSAEYAKISPVLAEAVELGELA